MMLRTIRSTKIGKRILRQFGNDNIFNEGNYVEGLDEIKAAKKGTFNARNKVQDKEPVQLRNAMINALSGLQKQMKIDKPVEKKKIHPSLTYGTGKTKINKQASGLKGLSLLVHKEKQAREQQEQLLLTQVDLGEMTNDELIYSPVYQYGLQMRSKLRKIQAENERKIREFRHAEITKQDHPNPPEDKQYLTFKTFFDTLESAKNNLKTKNPNLYRFYTRTGVFKSLDPTKFSPGDLNIPEYPGTVKGDRPEDDPQFYEMWIASNATPLMREIARLFNSDGEDERNVDPSLTDEANMHRNKGTSIYNIETFALDELSYRDYQNNKELAYSELEKKDSFILNRSNIEQEDIDVQLDSLPENLSLATEAIFTLDQFRGFKKLKEFADQIEESKYLPEEEHAIQAEEGDTDYPTIYGYFNLLPEKMKEVEEVQDAVRLLDKYGSRYTMEKKQEILNNVCYQHLPTTEEFDYMMKMGKPPTKPKWNAKQVMRFLLEEEKTFPEARDLDSFEMELSFEDKLKIDSEIDKLDGDFYRDHDSWKEKSREENYTPLPFHFYDNEDGFWDGWIENKRVNFGNTPLLRRRKHFYH